MRRLTRRCATCRQYRVRVWWHNRRLRFYGLCMTGRIRGLHTPPTSGCSCHHGRLRTPRTMLRAASKLSEWWQGLDRYNFCLWVTAYDITREWGGPEEGGWWWDNWQPVDTVPTFWPVTRQSNRVQSLITRLREKHADKEWGDISSMAGGVKLAVWPEWARHMSRTKYRPHYE